MRIWRVAVQPLIVAIVLGCASAPLEVPVAEESDVALERIVQVTRTMQLTGPQSPNQTDEYTVWGTDLGSMFEHDGRIFIVFGDTFGPRSEGHTGAGGALWRSNTMAYTTDRDATDGIRIDGWITDAVGTAKEIIPGRKNSFEVTKIPTHGVSANSNMYVYFMSVSHWGDHGQWDANYSGVARSTDSGQTFDIIEGLQWPGDSNFIQMAIAPYGDHFYFWAIPAGRFGGAHLMRVNQNQVEELDAFEYYSGMRGGVPVWRRSPDDAVMIVEPPVGELSVVWNPYLQRWIMTYLNEDTAAIELREAREPWGPWSTPFRLAHASRYPALYGAYMHPAYFEEEGRVIYFNMSQWLPYNVFVMRAELSRK